MSKEELIEKIETLIVITYDSQLPFESKVNYVSDFDYSLEKIMEGIVFDTPKVSLDKLKGLKQAVSIGIKFDEMLDELITEIESNWI